MPETSASTPASEWRLSEEGRRRCRPLAHRLKVYSPASIYSSTEPKARDTASLLAEELATNFITRPGVEEQHRDNEPWLDKAEDFDNAISGFFANSEKLVYGQETAIQALDRFDAAIQRTIRDANESNVIVVCHGTVISLLLSRYSGTEPMDVWRRLTLPSFVVLKTPEFDLLDIVTNIT
jgi:broad specificity phosphatase PhoE